MFYERALINRSVTIASVFRAYGIKLVHFNEIIGLSQNKHLWVPGHRRPGRGLTSNMRFTQPTFICLPIDISIKVEEARTIIDRRHGLRPVPVGTMRSECTHGVIVRLRRNGLSCPRIRWVQTVRKLNNPEPNTPTKFVDIGGNGFPFYNKWPIDDPEVENPLIFDDTPCGPEPPSPGSGVDFSAVVSAVVWTGNRITLIKGLRYHYQIQQNDHIDFSEPRPATSSDYDQQIRILRQGINQDNRDTGRSLTYRLPPRRGSING